MGLLCRDEAEGLFQSLESSDATTPKATESKDLASGFEATYVSPGALDESDFPSLSTSPMPSKVVHWTSQLSNSIALNSNQSLQEYP